MTNKHFMIFQTAVRKYLDMHEKVKVAIFSVVFTNFKKKNPKKFLSKNAKIFIML
jgi:hypothetical protein